MVRRPARARPRFLPGPELDESTFVGDLLRSETVGGSIALLGALVALVWANLAGESYTAVRELRLGPLDVQHWAEDGALSVFFFVAGLELKRELVVGSLRRPAEAVVPVVAACAGVAVPALFFVLVNRGTDNLVGWAVPAATDIAFALAILAVVGSGLPPQLRAFLLTLAVVDDLLVIAVIAVFYTEQLHLVGLALAGTGFAAYALLQACRVRSSFLYLPVAVLAWAGVHDSGVHATVSGVVLGLLTRVRQDPEEKRSPAERLEHRLSPLSSRVAVPLFALMSAGVPLAGGMDLVRDPIVLGVLAGLVLGKPVGVLGGSWLVTRFTRASLEESLQWRDLLGVGIVGGVGFTVSLLVADLSFTGAANEGAKTGVLLASALSGLLGALVLGRRSRRHRRS